MIEEVVKAMGVKTVLVFDPVRQLAELESTVVSALQSNDLTVIVARQPCLLAAGRIRSYEQTPVPSKP